VSGVDLSADGDDTLLRAVARGDAAAFEELYDRLAPMVLLRLRRRCADDDVVADVMQETFGAVWRAAGTWDGRGDVGAWVWTIAARRLVDAFRRRAAHGGPTVAHVDLEHALSVSRARTSARSAEEEVMSGLLAGPLAAAVAGLAPELQAVLQATVLDGLSTREASVLLGVPEGTVKTRAMRARIQVRQALA
jgi:RNA polymerase sigma-70 factor (ECF subfamily)